MEKSEISLTPSGLTSFHLRLYQAAFPPEERRTAGREIPADPAFRLYNISATGMPRAGLLTLWDFGTFRYIEHLAVDDSLRGRGIGAGALARVADPVVLEVEPPESGEMAARRVAFYKRQGFRLLDVAYVQPPYASHLPSVRLCLMLRGELEIPVSELIRTLHSRVYGAVDF